jgi:hypothetical protein
MQRIFIKKSSLHVLGSVCRIKRFHLCGKHFVDYEEFETKGSGRVNNLWALTLW